MAVRTARRRAVMALGAALFALSAAACGSGDEADVVSDAPSASTAASGPSRDAPAAADPAVLSALPVRMEADGTTITVGDPAAKNTVAVYEDLRCPVCKEFEAATGPQLATLAKEGKVKIQYTLASFLDGNFEGDGSKKAANALRASVEAGKFPLYHEALYADQPDERVDGFTDEFLLEHADRISGLRSTAFDAAVTSGKYSDFVSKSEKAFEASGATGTPMVKINGEQLSQSDSQKMFDAEQFAGLLRAAGIG